MRLYAQEKVKAGDLAEAKVVYHDVVDRFENVQAMLTLYNLYSKDEPERAFFYLETAVNKDTTLKPHTYFVYAAMLSKRTSPKEALLFMEKAALSESLWAIVELIKWYENGTATISRDEDKAKSWRAKLPSMWHSLPVE